MALINPVKEEQRINSIDIMRGVALLGILLMNIVGMALPDPAYRDPSGYGGDTGWNLRFFMVNELLIEGTMRAIFSMLFGAGVILFTERKEASGTGPEIARAWYRRTGGLIVFGLIHAYLLIWPGEVLYFYGIVGMFLFPVRHAAPRKLIGFAIFLFLVIASLNIVDSNKVSRLYERSQAIQEKQAAGGQITEAQPADLLAWEKIERDFKPDEKTKEEVVKKMRSGYFSAIKAMAPVTLSVQTTYFFRHGFLDVLSMMLLGMGFLKSGIFHGERKTGFYALMVLIGYGTGITVNWFETACYIREHFSVLSYFRNQQTYDLGRVFTTMGHVGLVMIFAKSNFAGFLKRSLAAVGRMALTNYIMQTIIATTIFGILGQFGRWQRYELCFLVAGIWIFQLIMSPIWLKYCKFGPLEYIWRWLTYGVRPQLVNY